MNAVAGTGVAARLVLRRDRVLIPVWVLLVTAFVAGTASSFGASYPTAAARDAFVATVASNPAIVALIGPVLDPGLGGLTAWRVGTAGAVIVAVIAVLATVRHTRAEEVAGRHDLMRSAAVGRLAPLAAAVLVLDVAFALMALLITGALVALGLAAPGSLALGLALASVGWIGTAVAAVAAEVCARARAASAVGIAVMALAVLLKMGAAGPWSWLVWVGPVGWAQQLRPFAGERWWVLGLVAATVVVLLGVAGRLRSRRDLGSGLLAERPGPAHGTLSGVFGLAWRQQRGLLLAMVVGFAVLGLLLGAAADGAAQAGPQLGPFLARLGVPDPGEALVVLLVYVFAEVLAAYTIMSVLRPRADESDGLGAVLLATPVSRVRWMCGHLLVAALGTAAIMLALGATVGLSHGIAVGDVGGEMARSVLTALAKVPAVWVIGAVAALAHGLVPRAATAVSWTVFAAVLIVEIGWEFGRFGDGVFAVSPFSWVYPLAGRGSAGALAGLTVVAAVLAGGGLLALRRRDVG